jgi:hypothetical protein
LSKPHDCDFCGIQAFQEVFMTDLSEPAPIASASTQKVGGSSFGRSAVAATVGTTIEWYDFQIYGLAAALIFNNQFFPNFDPVAGTLLSFATFAIGFWLGRSALFYSATWVIGWDANRPSSPPSC